MNFNQIVLILIITFISTNLNANLSNNEISEINKLGGSKEEYLKFKKSGFTLKEYIKSKKLGLNLNQYSKYIKLRKKPGKAVALSLLLPGVGNYYGKNYGRGTMYLTSFIGSVLVIAINRDYLYSYKWEFGSSGGPTAMGDFHISNKEDINKKRDEKIKALEAEFGLSFFQELKKKIKVHLGPLDYAFIGVACGIYLISIMDAILNIHSKNKKLAEEIKGNKVSNNFSTFIDFNFVQKKGIIGVQYSF